MNKTKYQAPLVFNLWITYWIYRAWHTIIYRIYKTYRPSEIYIFDILFTRYIIVYPCINGKSKKSNFITSSIKNFWLSSGLFEFTTTQKGDKGGKDGWQLVHH